MAVKIIGAEWKRFYSDKSWWPDGAYHEDEEITINGEPADFITNLEEVDDNAAIILSGGMVLLLNGKADISFESYFRKWRKAQNSVWFICESPREKAELVKEAILRAGGKVNVG